MVKSKQCCQTFFDCMAQYTKTVFTYSGYAMVLSPRLRTAWEKAPWIVIVLQFYWSSLATTMAIHGKTTFDFCHIARTAAQLLHVNQYTLRLEAHMLLVWKQKVWRKDWYFSFLLFSFSLLADNMQMVYRWHIQQCKHALRTRAAILLE